MSVRNGCLRLGKNYLKSGYSKFVTLHELSAYAKKSHMQKFRIKKPLCVYYRPIFRKCAHFRVCRHFSFNDRDFCRLFRICFQFSAAICRIIAYATAIICAKFMRPKKSHADLFHFLLENSNWMILKITFPNNLPPISNNCYPILNVFPWYHIFRILSKNSSEIENFKNIWGLRNVSR